MEGLERLRAKFTIDLHPSRLANASEGVRAHLSSLLLRYNEDLEGVLLSFRNERLLTRQASIHPYFPYVRVEVAADVVLFRVRPGMRLVGTVNKVGADYLGLLVLGFINAAIAADCIRPEFRPRLGEHCWASSKAASHRMEVGTKVHFDVAAVQHHGAFVSIAGSLQQAGTGAEGFAKPPKRAGVGGSGAAASAAPAIQGGSKKQQRQQQQQHQVAQQQPVQQQPPEKKKDKKKKRERQQEQGQATAAATSVAQQQQQPAGQAPREAASGKSGGRGKQQAMAAAAAAPAADGAGGKNKKEKKDKKRKAEDTPTLAAGATAAVAAAVNGGSTAEQQKQKKKKKREAAA